MDTLYTNKWVRQIIALQQADGSWGNFHSLRQPTREQPMTTEQALRRLHILDLSCDDAPVEKALDYMRSCLSGEREIPDRREKVLHWDAFQAHMLAAWIRCFVPDDPLALPVARFWAELVSAAFAQGAFNESAYTEAYRKKIPQLHKGERCIMLSQFYMVQLLQGILDADTEAYFINYIIHHPDGMYYVYDGCIAQVPPVFASRQTSRYIAALELLAPYAAARECLDFARDWLYAHQNADGNWDLGATARDGIYLPLSDSWRSPATRVHDCSLRIENLLEVLRL